MCRVALMQKMMGEIFSSLLYCADWWVYLLESAYRILLRSRIRLHGVRVCFCRCRHSSLRSTELNYGRRRYSLPVLRQLDLYLQEHRLFSASTRGAFLSRRWYISLR